MEKIPEAIADFEKATKLDQDNKQAWYNLGNTYYRSEDYKKATLAFQADY
jgi:tetratricopeptide (TPR) repeat protein